MAGRKVFVGSLPDGIQESVVREEFNKYGNIEDLFVKQGCERGRQWAMVTFSTESEALRAKEATDRILKLPGAERAVEVMIARNQKGDSGGSSRPPPSPSPYLSGTPYGVPESSAPKKIFVGSLPDGITESQLREEFSRYGEITDLFLKTGCERNKQWAFVTYSNQQDAEFAKTNADRKTRFPGSDMPCEVMLARNQGMHGRDPISAPPNLSGGPTKIFVGSLPDDITETALREEFSKHGQIMDVFLKTGCDRNKQWAFLVFATNQQAQQAKDATDRVLKFPNSSQACEVMFAKFQGKNGQDPLNSGSSGGSSSAGGMPPAQYAWRAYQSPQGIPYYHNHATGVTQWECPPEFHHAMAMHQAAWAQSAYAAQAAAAGGAPPPGPMGYPPVGAYGPVYSLPPSSVYRPY